MIICLYILAYLRAIDMTSTLSEEKLKEYHDVAVDLVIQCGPIFEEGYNKTNKEVMVKAAFFDFVTVYDRQIEQKLSEGLLKAFPESRFIGEESLAGVKQLPELTNAPTWIIDPIDGTTNYIHRLPHCGISVALAVDRELVVGIIYNPAANEMFTTQKGHGAFLNGERIQVSAATTVCIQTVFNVEDYEYFKCNVELYNYISLTFRYQAQLLAMK